MGCNCKQKKDTTNVDDKKIIVVNDKVKGFGLFLLSIGILPFLFPVVVVVLFKHFVIGGEIDITRSIEKVFNKSKKEIEEDDYLQGEDNLEMEDVID